MYPLKIILVNFADQALVTVRTALEVNQALIETVYSDVNEAIEKWSVPENEQHLCLFHAKSLQDVHDLECLKRAFNWPILALVDAAREQIATLLILANRAGASQVVAMPLDLDDLRAGMDAICREYGVLGNQAKVVAVAGVTGGCGATTIAINLANEAAVRYGRRCILLELALQRGMVATYLNAEPQYVLPDLLQPGVKLDLHLIEQALTKISENFDIISGAHFEITPLEVPQQEIVRLIELSQRLCQVLVLDVPGTGNDQFLQTIAAANHVVLVAEQNLPSLRALRLVLDMLGRVNLANAATGGFTVEVVLNRYDPRSKDFDLPRVRGVLGEPSMLTVANDYKSVNAAVNNGVPLRTEAPKSRVLADIVTLSEKLFGEKETPAKKNGLGLFGRLAQAFAGSPGG